MNVLWRQVLVLHLSLSEVSGWQPGQDQAQWRSDTKELESYVFTYHCAGQELGVGFEQKQ